MKLTDILREIEGEEDGMSQLKVNYDLAVQPKDIDAALEAMDNISNYGIYAQNMRDPQAIVKAFGPSIPAQKAGAAWKDWDTRSEDEKAFKLIDLKNRVPEAFATAEKEVFLRFKYIWQPEDYRITKDSLLEGIVNSNKIYKKGDKVCQLKATRVENIQFVLVNELDTTSRGEGGFGSTDTKKAPSAEDASKHMTTMEALYNKVGGVPTPSKKYTELMKERNLQ